jgi:flagellar basal-body rod protein FlgC
MLSTLDISTSALVAQRTRVTAIASNIANVSTTHNEAGEAEPYQPRFVVFETDNSIQGPGGAPGVKVASVEISNVEPNWKFQPGHPDAIKSGPRAGYVAYPNVDMTTEFVDALEATRAYEANVGVIEITKNLTLQSLKIIA